MLLTPHKGDINVKSSDAFSENFFFPLRAIAENGGKKFVDETLFLHYNLTSHFSLLNILEEVFILLAEM